VPDKKESPFVYSPEPLEVVPREEHHHTIAGEGPTDEGMRVTTINDPTRNGKRCVARPGARFARTLSSRLPYGVA